MGLNGGENEPIDFFSLVSVSTAHFHCVLLHSCLIGCMLKCYTLQGWPLLPLIKWQIGGTVFFQRSQAHRCVCRSPCPSLALSVPPSALSFFSPSPAILFSLLLSCILTTCQLSDEHFNSALLIQLFFILVLFLSSAYIYI